MHKLVYLNVSTLHNPLNYILVRESIVSSYEITRSITSQNITYEFNIFATNYITHKCIFGYLL